MHIWFLVFTWTVLPGQWRSYTFSTFDATDGLNSDRIASICQDSTGYLYFAGSNSLIRYDGNTFRAFSHHPEDATSIGPGHLQTLLTGSDGKIWIGMRRNGLNCYDPQTEQFTRHQIPTQNGIVSAIMEDEQGYLWLGGDGFALYRFDMQTAEIESFLPPEELVTGDLIPVTRIHQDIRHPDKIWFTGFGYSLPGYAHRSQYVLMCFDRLTQRFTVEPCIGNVEFQSVDGTLWGGSWAAGLWSYDPAEQQCTNYRFDVVLPSGHRHQDGIFDILPVRKNLWLAMRDAVLEYDVRGTYDAVLLEDGLGTVAEFFQDKGKNIWIGTDRKLMCVNPDDQHIKFYSLGEHGATERIYPGRLAHDPDRDMVYLATRDEPRLYYIPLRGDDRTTPGYYPLPFSVFGVAVRDDGKLWLSGNGALYLFDPVSRQLTRMPADRLDGEEIPWLWNLRKHKDGTIAAVGMRAVLRFDQDLTFFNRFLLENDRFQLSGCEFGPSNDLFVWTNRLYHLESGSNEWTLLRGVHNVDGMAIDSAGAVWVGGLNSIGKYRLTGDSLHLVRYYTNEDGLKNSTCNELHVDKSGRVWLFTGTGMSCIDPVTDEVRNFGVLEGLPDPFIDPRQILTIDDGRMVTVNGNGLIVFHPDSLWETGSQKDISIVVKDVRVAGRSLPLSRAVNLVSHVELGPKDNFIDVEFQGMAFPNDRNVTYSYRVGGLNDDWIFIGQNNFVALSGLRPGSYTLEIKAGRATSRAPVKALSFHIAKPVYLRTWFLLLGILLLVAALYALYRWRIIQVKKQAADKAEVNRRIAELELKSLRSQMNPHFMFNSLNSIKNFILKRNPDQAAEYLSDFAHLIRMILQNSREKTVSLQDELDALLLYIELEKLRFDNEFHFNCVVDESIDLETVVIPPMILQPYVENAIWHGLMHKEKQGHLTLSFTRANGLIHCSVEDDGVGREKAQALKSLSAVRYKSMGLGITNDRLELINRMDALGIEVQVIDKADTDGNPLGTKVVVIIPVTQSDSTDV